jgi:hypothetical protein
MYLPKKYNFFFFEILFLGYRMLLLLVTLKHH